MRKVHDCRVDGVSVAAVEYDHRSKQLSATLFLHVDGRSVATLSLVNADEDQAVRDAFGALVSALERCAADKVLGRPDGVSSPAELPRGLVTPATV